MSDDAPDALRRRRLLRALGVSAAASALAGCSGDGGSGGGGGEDGGGGDGAGGGDGSDGDTGGTDGGGDRSGTPDPTPTATQSPAPTATQSPTPTASAESTTAAEEASTPAATSTPTPTASGEQVAADVSLQVRGSRSNVDEFDTLQTTFEAIELVPTSGDAVRLDDETREIDLTEVGAGGTVDLFETTLPAGNYEEGRLYLPIQEAELAGGGEPEFSNTVPATRELGFSDPLELSAGDTIDFTVIVALLRIAGDGPWTYTIGFSTAWV